MLRAPKGEMTHWVIHKYCATDKELVGTHPGKNFFGLSVCEGYIATGSETHEVFIYHKALPMPALSYKFNTTDPISGDEVDDSEQFISSSVCWRNQSSTLIAAHSMGDIKLLEMV